MQELAQVNCDEEVLLHSVLAPPDCCNLCGGEDFGPGPGGRMASNGMAPHCRQCGSLERHRSIARVLRAWPQHALAGRNALLVGAEQGVQAGWFASSTSVLLAELQETDARYDVISSSYSLEFVAQDREKFDLMHRLLTPGGIMALCFIAPETRDATVTGLNTQQRAGHPY